MILYDYIERYRNYLYENEKSRATIEKYTHAIESLALFLAGREVSKSEMIAFRENLLTQHRAQTVNGYLSAVNAFLTFIGLTDCRVKLLKVQRRAFLDVDKELTEEEYRRLLSAAKNRGSERLYLLMQTLCAAGIRVSELRYITVAAAAHGVAEITLKGKIRTILLPRPLCRKLLQYAKQEKIASGEIFLTKGGKPMSRKQVWAEMKSLCVAAGVEPRKVFPHNLRRIFARAFYRVCHDVSKLADVLGHSSIETTRLYIMSTGVEHAGIMTKMRLLC